MNTLQSTPAPVLTLPTNRPLKSEVENCPAPEPQESLERNAFYDAGANTVAAFTGLASGLTRVIVGGCAGAAQGVVHGINVKQDQLSLAFKASMAANLALTGALAGGVGGFDFLSLSPAQGALAGAATNAMAGNAQWESASTEFQEAVRNNASKWMDSALQSLPEAISKGDGVMSKIARGTVGEFVGLTAGVYTGAMMIGSNYRAGVEWGNRALEKTANFFSPESIPA